MNVSIILISPHFQMDLQRRGQAKSELYWRCYFNAI